MSLIHTGAGTEIGVEFHPYRFYKQCRFMLVSVVGFAHLNGNSRTYVHYAVCGRESRGQGSLELEKQQISFQDRLLSSIKYNKNSKKGSF